MGMTRQINLDGPLSPEPFDNSKVSACGPDVNPLGLMRHSPTSLMLATGFMEFISPEPLMLGGLCRVRPGHAEILAIGTTDPGSGHFRRFITALEPLAGKVTFWSMLSKEFASTLLRHGYQPVRLQDNKGLWHDCLTKTIWEDERVGLPAGVGDRSESPLGQIRPQDVGVG